MKWAWLVLGVIALRGAAGVACSPAVPTPAEQLEVATCSAQLHACVAEAATRAEWRACSDRVETQCGWAK